MGSELMLKAVRLGLKGRGKVKARPLVGCVVEKSGEIIGTGYHGESGRKHAEAIALEKAGKKASGADLYTTLEPCSNKGLTGPCAEKIVKAGIARVFVGTLDPNPKNKGKGIKGLEKAGIELELGVLEPYAVALNDYYNKWVVSGKPFVVLKSALTRDGFISWGDGKKKKITGKEADKYVHDYRAECDCILVGIGTVQKDDPKLVCGKKGCRNPVRVVLDPGLAMPVKAKMLRDGGKTIIFHLKGVSAKKRKALEKKKVECVAVKGKKGMVDLRKVLGELGKRNHMSVLVEGGRKVNTSFLKEGLVDKIALVFSRKNVGFGLKFCEDSVSGQIRLKKGDIRKLGGDVLVEGYLK